jgi:hypothetical protein
MKAFSTLVELFAEVSMKAMPSESANSFACSYDTARLEVRSDLFPTRSLFTFSEAYLFSRRQILGKLRTHTAMDVGTTLRKLPIDFVKPLLHVVEALQICGVINNDDSVGAPVITRSDRPEALLPGGIPLQVTLCTR